MSWKYFHIREFACNCGCGRTDMQSDFIDKLDTLREECGFPLVVNSGYRCPEHNAKVSSTGKTGPHTTGRAVDIGIRGKQARELLRHADAFTGIGIKQHGSGRFIHLDDLDGPTRPWVWGYA